MIQELINSGVQIALALLLVFAGWLMHGVSNAIAYPALAFL